MLSRLRSFLRAALGRRRLEDDISTEVAFHVDAYAEDLERAGVPRDEARRRARAELGSVHAMRDAARQARGLWLVDELAQLARDLRTAGRALVMSRSYALLSVLCLGAAIGTNTATFAFVNPLILRPIPVDAPDDLVEVREARRDNPQRESYASYPNFLDWQQHVADVMDLMALRGVSLHVADSRGADRIAGALVSWDLFTVLGVQPALGRGFLEIEDRAGGPPVVLISHAMWQRRYGADPAVIGQSIVVDGVPRTVVGVMPATLSHIALREILRGSQMWVPLGSIDHASLRDERTLAVGARLRDGATLDAARIRLDAVVGQLEHVHPRENEGWIATIAPLSLGFSATTTGMLMTAVGAVGVVLLIACANVANLTLARTSSRRREIATRLALGASRLRVVRQLLGESLLIALASVPVGVALAYLMRALLLGSSGAGTIAELVVIDVHVLVFTIVLAIVASLLSGLLPALLVVGRVQHAAMKDHGRRGVSSGAPGSRSSAVLIVGEVALALTLLVGASLFVQTFHYMLTAEGSFDTSRILTVSIEAGEGDSGAGISPVSLTRDLAGRFHALPDVAAVAAATLMPLRTGGVRTAIVADHTSSRAVDDGQMVLVGHVTSGFFGAIDVPIREGRAFSDTEDRAGAPVAVVNRTMARLLWPGEDALGRRFRRATDQGDARTTVIGVSDDILTWNLSNRPLPTAYLPYAQGSADARQALMLIRTTAEPSRLATSARNVVTSIDPTLRVEVATMTDVHHDTLSRSRTLAGLFVVLGGMALLLGATGVYGVLSHFVSQRTYEIGIRAALGADRRQLVGLFVRQGMAMTFAGVVIGAAGAWMLARVLRRFLFGVTPADPLSFAIATLLIAGVGLAAAYVPARRAATVDPVIAMRE